MCYNRAQERPWAICRGCLMWESPGRIEVILVAEKEKSHLVIIIEVALISALLGSLARILEEILK